jgi:hypothetical protein
MLDTISSGIPPQPGTGPYEVPILDLIVSKRKSKDKGMPLHPFYLINDSLINHCCYNIAILDSWDVLPKPRSRVIIALEDEDQEFVDGWVPDSYVEGEGNDRDTDGPLYSEEERNRKDGERRTMS